MLGRLSPRLLTLLAALLACAGRSIAADAETVCFVQSRDAYCTLAQPAAPGSACLCWDAREAAGQVASRDPATGVVAVAGRSEEAAASAALRGLTAGAAFAARQGAVAGAVRSPRQLASPGFPVAAAAPAQKAAAAVRLPICRPEGTGSYCEMASNGRIGAGCVCWDFRDRPGRIEAVSATGEPPGGAQQRLPSPGFPR